MQHTLSTAYASSAAYLNHSLSCRCYLCSLRMVRRGVLVVISCDGCRGEGRVPDEDRAKGQQNKGYESET